MALFNCLGFIIDFGLYLLGCAFIGLSVSGYLPSRRRGFYCDDRSITYAFNGDTITTTVLVIGTIAVPLILIATIEISKIFSTYKNRELRRSLLNYLIGFLILIIITEFAKYLFAEHRPHFLYTCQPDFTTVNCTEYVTTYTCTNKNVSAMAMLDASKSFPSGHSSMAFFSGVYMILYLQKNVSMAWSVLIKPFLQLSWFIWAVTCALTRIYDYRHHWWDVLVGSVLGIVCAYITIKYKNPNTAMDLLNKKELRNSDENEELEMVITSQPNSNINSELDQPTASQSTNIRVKRKEFFKLLNLKTK